MSLVAEILERFDKLTVPELVDLKKQIEEKYGVTPAAPVMMAGVMAGLLALGQPRYPLYVSGIVGAIELALLFWLVPQTGYLGASGLFSAYLAVSVLWMVWRGLTLIKQEEAE